MVGGDPNALADCVVVFSINLDMNTLILNSTYASTFTNSQMPFSMLSKASTVTDEHFLIELSAVTEAFDGSEFSNIGLLRSKNNVAAGLLKLYTSVSLH